MQILMKSVIVAVFVVGVVETVETVAVAVVVAVGKEFEGDQTKIQVVKWSNFVEMVQYLVAMIWIIDHLDHY